MSVPLDFLIEVAKGKVTGHSIINKFGRNPDIDAGFEALWNGGGFYTGFNATTAETLEIASSDVNDTAAGTGARKVIISGLLDENYNQMDDVEITLNGTTNVSLGSQTYIRASRMKVIEAGSVGSNIGTLTLRHTTTTANIFAVMPIGYNQTMIAAFTIPNHHEGLLLDWFAATSKKQAAFCNVRLVMRNFGGVFQVKEEMTASTTGTSVPIRSYTLPKNNLTAKTDIYIESDTDTVNMGVAGGFDLLMYKV